jgi:hypothetical protein
MRIERRLSPHAEAESSGNIWDVAPKVFPATRDPLLDPDDMSDPMTRAATAEMARIFFKERIETPIARALSPAYSSSSETTRDLPPSPLHLESTKTVR